MNRYPNIDAAIRATCIEHNIRGCNVCNKVVGECDFGGCHRTATGSVSLLNAGGVVGEVRPTCKGHVTLMRQGAPYGVAA